MKKQDDIQDMKIPWLIPWYFFCMFSICIGPAVLPISHQHAAELL